MGICPSCSGEARRLFHAVPVIYKGSGFYTTDYGRAKRPLEDGAKDSSEAKPVSGEATSSAKPADSAKPASGDGAASSAASKSEPATGPAKESTAAK